MEYLYHPISGEKILIEELDDASAFIEDRLFKPKTWKKFHYGIEDEDSFTYGIEIELNTSVDADFDKVARIEICRELLKVLNKDGKHFHIMRDNSVRNGIELVSAPMTFKYWIETFDVKEINDLFKKLNLSATLDTGLHIHVGIRHTRRIRDIFIQLFAVSYPMWAYLSNRRYHRIQDRFVSTSYFYEKPELRSRYKATLESLIKNGNSNVDYYKIDYYDYYVEDRYLGLNFYNEKTIEFRMFAGTSDFFEVYKYLMLVNTIVLLADEIKTSRVNDVFSLKAFVERTKSELMLEETVEYIRFVNSEYNKKRVYNNSFQYLDAYWYRVYFDMLKVKDLMIEKIIFNQYEDLLKKKEELLDNCLEYLSIDKDIDNLLKNNIYEVVKVDSDHIYCIHVNGSTNLLKFDKSICQDYIFVRPISSNLILK